MTIQTAEIIPRGPLVEGSGELSRNWRNWFEGNRRQNGEVLSGITTINSAITVIEGQITAIDGTLSSYYAISVDGGGNGAFLRLSDGAAVGSAIVLNASDITLAADAINFGTQTTFNTASETFITEAGGVRTRYGAPFGASSDLLRWYGPTSVAQGSETRTNGYLTEGTDGVVRLGASAFNWGATAAEAAASNALIPAYGTNIIRSTHFPDVTRWIVSNNTTGLSATFARFTDSNNEAYVQYSATGTATGVHQLAIQNSESLNKINVTAGGRYEFGADCYFNPSGASAEILVLWRNAAGSTVGSTVTVGTGSVSGNWFRVSAFATAPSDAASALFLPRMFTFNGAVNPFIAFRRPFAGRARTEQTTFTPYAPGAEADLNADPTAVNTAAAITGQGNLATANNARGTTAARPAAANTWSFYANTTTNTLQIDVPTTGWVDVATLSTAVQTRGKILGPAAVSFSANNTWQEVAQVDVSDVPSGGVIQVPYVDVVGQSQSGPVIGSGYSWRLTEALVSSPSSKTVIKSGAITITAGAGTDPPTVDDVVQPTAALVTVTNTGSVRYIIEVQRTSGTATIGLQLTANFIVGPS